MFLALLFHPLPLFDKYTIQGSDFSIIKNYI